MTISHCTVRNFNTGGITLQPAGNTAFLIADVTISGNRFFGINVSPRAIATVKGTLDHVSADKNGSGILVAGAAVLALDSTATNNTGTGFSVDGAGAVLRLFHSAATGNGTGVRERGSPAESAGDNFIRGNGTDVDVSLTPVGTK